MTRRPERWLDGDACPPGARELLSSAGAPDPAARERVWAALSRATAPGAAGATVASAPLVGSAVAAKAVAALALVALAAAPAVRSRATSLARPSPASSVARPRSAPVAPPSAHAPASPLAAPSPSPVAPSPSVPVASSPAAPVVVRVVARPSTSPAALRASGAVARRAAPVPVAALAQPALTLDDELRALTLARASIRSDPAAALGALEAFRARAPGDGVLGLERERYAVEALSRLGRGDEARARAERLLAANPNSTVAARVRALRDAIDAGRTIP